MRCGTSYLFQIRLPIALGGGRAAPPIRIGIGARPAHDARRIAGILATLARAEFARLEARRMSEDETKGFVPEIEPMFSGDDPKEVVIEMRGYMKAMYQQIKGEPPEPHSSQADALAGLKGLVRIAREIEKGPEGDQMIVDNADMLKARYVEQFAGTALTPPPAAARGSSSLVSPAAQPTVQPPAAAPSAVLPPVAVAPVVEPRPLDAEGRPVPAYLLDRRFVARKASNLPRFSEVSDEYLAYRTLASPSKQHDVGTARFRRNLFIELIGDHPVDTYNAADLQAFVHLLTYWPAEETERRADWTARQIIEDNRDLHLKPLKLSVFQEGYVGVIKTMMRHQMNELSYSDPFAGARVRYPETAAPKRSSEPLSAEKISTIFRIGVASGFLDQAMLPLLGHLTGRRLGLLIHLQGADIREKFPGIFVAETAGIVSHGGRWTRVPYKTDASASYFVLHPFLKEIGFVDWARAQEDGFLFPEIMRLVDPSRSASSYMGRLFEKAGIEKGKGEVFHSLRGGNIDDMRDEKVDGRLRRLQSGHTIGGDEHEGYGRQSLGEKGARQIAALPLNPEIDFSMFQGVDFDAMAKRKRTRGRQPKG